jgi:hypothetical protein
MSFPRHEEIYHPIRTANRLGRPSCGRPSADRYDEFQLAIPWRVALPQSPPPLRQPGRIVQQKHWAAQSKSSERRIVS